MSSMRSMAREEAVLWLRQQPQCADLVLACFYDDPLIAASQRCWQSAEWGAVRRFLPEAPCKALDIAGLRLDEVLNPFERPINNYPSTKSEIRARLSPRAALPVPGLVPDAALTWARRWINTPGRLFSFVARKPTHD